MLILRHLEQLSRSWRITVPEVLCCLDVSCWKQSAKLSWKRNHPPGAALLYVVVRPAGENSVPGVLLWSVREGAGCLAVPKLSDCVTASMWRCRLQWSLRIDVAL